MGRSVRCVTAMNCAYPRPDSEVDSIVVGNVIHVAVWGQPIVFLNSRDAAFDLLDKRGAIYSDRPKMVMAGDLLVYFFTRPQ